MAEETASGTGDPEPRGARQRPIDSKLLEILVCPLTKGPLRYDEAAQELVSDRAGLAFPIRDGIPIMLVDEARRIAGD
ncbi:MAG: Trm112 family protein [Defluviicoccus sp.]|nr:Trm112 family protein [Defluviicoccus sp.]